MASPAAGAIAHNATEVISALGGQAGSVAHNATGVAHNATGVMSGLGGGAGAQAADVAFSWGGYFQAIGVMLFLVAALWFFVWLLRKYGKFRFLPQPGALPREALFLEAQMPMGAKGGLSVVRFMDKRLLLGVTEHTITLLQEVPLNQGGSGGEGGSGSRNGVGSQSAPVTVQGCGKSAGSRKTGFREAGSYQMGSCETGSRKDEEHEDFTAILDKATRR